MMLRNLFNELKKKPDVQHIAMMNILPPNVHVFMIFHFFFKCLKIFSSRKARTEAI